MRFEHMTSPELDALDRDSTVLVLPLGAVEQHGNHMPVGTDTLISHALCLELAEHCPNVLVLPAPWYGFSAHHMRFAGSISLSHETLIALISDIVDSVVRHGFRRVLLVNGHGGNSGVIDVSSSILGHRHYGKARIAAVTYFQLSGSKIDAIRTTSSGGTGHAGEFETSVLQHLKPDLVHAARAVTTYPDTKSSYLTTDLTSSSAIKTYHDFGDLSESGTLGDPSHATAEKGKQFFEACVDDLAAFIADFQGWSVSGNQQ